MSNAISDLKLERIKHKLKEQFLNPKSPMRKLLLSEADKMGEATFRLYPMEVYLRAKPSSETDGNVVDLCFTDEGYQLNDGEKDEWIFTDDSTRFNLYREVCDIEIDAALIHFGIILEEVIIDENMSASLKQSEIRKVGKHKYFGCATYDIANEKMITHKNNHEGLITITRALHVLPYRGEKYLKFVVTDDFIENLYQVIAFRDLDRNIEKQLLLAFEAPDKVLTTDLSDTSMIKTLRVLSGHLDKPILQ